MGVAAAMESMHLNFFCPSLTGKHIFVQVVGDGELAHDEWQNVER